MKNRPAIGCEKKKTVRWSPEELGWDGLNDPEEMLQVQRSRQADKNWLLTAAVSARPKTTPSVTAAGVASTTCTYTNRQELVTYRCCICSPQTHSLRNCCWSSLHDLHIHKQPSLILIDRLLISYINKSNWQNGKWIFKYIALRQVKCGEILELLVHCAHISDTNEHQR